MFLSGLLWRHRFYNVVILGSPRVARPNIFSWSDTFIVLRFVAGGRLSEPIQCIAWRLFLWRGDPADTDGVLMRRVKFELFNSMRANTHLFSFPDFLAANRSGVAVYARFKKLLVCDRCLVRIFKDDVGSSWSFCRRNSGAFKNCPTWKPSSCKMLVPSKGVPWITILTTL